MFKIAGFSFKMADFVFKNFGLYNIAPQRLIRDLKPLKSVYLISFKTFKEYLIKREFVNMNIPIKEGDSQSDEEASMQLELF